MIIYILPTCCITCYYAGDTAADLLGTIYLLALIVIYDIYEFGYIQNDTKTVEHDEHPTLRLANDDLLFYKRNQGKVWLCRSIIAMVALAILYTAVGEEKAGFSIFMLLMIGLLGSFLIYNANQGKWKIFVHFILVCIRFMAFPFLLSGRVYLEPSFWFLIVVFPLPNLIERSSEAKFNIPFVQRLIGGRKNIDRFRVYYYLLAGVGVSLLTVFDRRYLIICVLMVYFFIYRLLIFLKLSLAKERRYSDA